ncbi:MAG TPA: hypothetical protein VKB18_07920 [Gemmatimonadota bacterium]|nr:hypothetical protein [Gemmatimonadota bacterium]
MPEHLEHETLSALIDEPEAWPAARDHLRGCTACRREFNVMRRMRMALSALDDLDPPEAGWEAIEARLPVREERERAAGWPTLDFGGGWLSGSVRAAAAVIVFAAGVGLGLWVAPPTVSGAASGTRAASPGLADAGPAQAAASPDGPAGATPASETTDGSAVAASLAPTDGSDSSVSLPPDLPRPYRVLYSRLQALRARGPSPSEVLQHPEEAAQHLARLDALIRASREALQDAPADPAINDFLFQVVAERDALDRALHVASLEYR